MWSYTGWVCHTDQLAPRHGLYAYLYELAKITACDRNHRLFPHSSAFSGSIRAGMNEMDPPLCGSASMSHNECTIRAPIEPQEASLMKPAMSVLGIDIAKRVFHAVGMDERGKIVWRKRLSRHDLMPFMAQLPPVLVGMEACGGAHYWARRFREHGHDVKLLAPQFVKPFVKSNKNDMRDAEAIAEAVTQPTMRFVPIKEIDQQDIQALHRVRERLIGARTALINEVHGLMLEYGIVLPKGVAKFRQAVVEKLEADKDKLTALSHELFWQLVQESLLLDSRVLRDQQLNERRQQRFASLADVVHELEEPQVEREFLLGNAPMRTQP